MNKSKEMIKKVVEELKEIYDEEDFLKAISSALKNDYECEHFLRLINKYIVHTPDNSLIIALLISEAGEKAKRKGDYLKDIDTKIEGALLEETPEAEDNTWNINDLMDTANSGGLDELLDKAESGNPNDMFYAVCAIGMSNIESEDSENELMQRRFLYLQKLVKTKGFESTLIMMGDAYANGDGVPQDAEEAIRWYKKAVKKGMTFGNECIGMLYYEGNGVPVDYKKALKYLTKDKGKKSFCTLYSLGEMYRQGLYVVKNPDKAWQYYQEIVDDESPSGKLDDYYWRACYRLGMALYEDSGSFASLDSALQLVTEAKDIYDNRGNNTTATDITRKELYQSWRALKKEVKVYKKIRKEMPVLMKVRCIVDDEPGLTKGKIYEVLTEEDGLYGVGDDEDVDVYLHGKSCFEIVERKE